MNSPFRHSAIVLSTRILCLGTLLVSEAWGCTPDTHQEAAQQIRDQYQDLVSSISNPESRFQLFSFFYSNQDVLYQKRGQAVALLKEAAESEYWPAVEILGFLYYEGDLLTQSEEEGIRLIESAATHGHVSTRIALGQLYFERALGFDESEKRGRDLQQAEHWLLLAFDKRSEMEDSDLAYANAFLGQVKLTIAIDDLEGWRLLNEAVEMDLEYAIRSKNVILDIVTRDAEAGIQEAMDILTMVEELE